TLKPAKFAPKVIAAAIIGSNLNDRATMTPTITKAITALATAPTAPAKAKIVDMTAINQNSLPFVLSTAARITPRKAPDFSIISNIAPVIKIRKIISADSTKPCWIELKKSRKPRDPPSVPWNVLGITRSTPSTVSLSNVPDGRIYVAKKPNNKTINKITYVSGILHLVVVFSVELVLSFFGIVTPLIKRNFQIFNINTYNNLPSVNIYIK